MHVQRLTIENIRSIQQLDIDLRGEGNPAGWHVLLGDNGAGKSTVVRALALALMGQSNAYATREDWSRWLTSGSDSGRIAVELSAHEWDEWTTGKAGRQSTDQSNSEHHHRDRRGEGRTDLGRQ